MVQFYHENYLRTDIKHHCEKCMILDQTNLAQGRVLLQNVTAVAGFAALMLEEVDIRKNALDANDRKKHSIVILKNKEHGKDKDSFKPHLPLKLLPSSLSLLYCFYDDMLLVKNKYGNMR